MIDGFCGSGGNVIQFSKYCSEVFAIDIDPKKLDICKNNFDNLRKSRILVNPEDIFIKYNNKMELVINKLHLLNPLNVMAKGYSIALKDNKTIKSIKEVNSGDEINLRVNDGIIITDVKGVKKNGNKEE